MLAGGTNAAAGVSGTRPRFPCLMNRLHILFSDERYVPSDSDASNYHQSRPLLDALALPATAVARVRTELPLDEAAADYERQLAALLDSGVRIGLGLLGLGADGHTGVTVWRGGPGARARTSGDRRAPPDGMSAVSVTPDFLSRVEELLFVVAGSGKGEALRALMRRIKTLSPGERCRAARRSSCGWAQPELKLPYRR